MLRSFARVTLVAALLASGACGKSQGGAPKTRPPPLVAVAPVESRDVPVEIQAPVDLKPLVQADVSSKVLGYLDAVLVDRGDHVTKGQTLALVRPSDLPDQLAAARGSVAQSDAALALARSNADRSRELLAQGLISKTEADQIASSLASAQAAQQSAKSQMAALAVKVGETRIESPLTGFVLARRLDPGALVGPPNATPILTVARTDVLRVFITVNETDAKDVRVGLEAHVEVDALPGERFSGHVTRLSPGFEATTRTLDAEVELANADGRLRPNMYGRGAIRVALHERATVIPAAAMRMSDKKRYVYVLDGEKVVRRPIETGVDGGTWLEVVRGLEAGQEIVTAGADLVADGMTVRVSRKDAGKAASAPPAGTTSAAAAEAKSGPAPGPVR